MMTIQATMLARMSQFRSRRLTPAAGGSEGMFACSAIIDGSAGGMRDPGPSSAAGSTCFSLTIICGSLGERDVRSVVPKIKKCHLAFRERAVLPHIGRQVEMLLIPSMHVSPKEATQFPAFASAASMHGCAEKIAAQEFGNVA